MPTNETIQADYKKLCEAYCEDPKVLAYSRTRQISHMRRFVFKVLKDQRGHTYKKIAETIGVSINAVYEGIKLLDSAIQVDSQTRKAYIDLTAVLEEIPCAA